MGEKKKNLNQQNVNGLLLRSSAGLSDILVNCGSRVQFSPDVFTFFFLLSLRWMDEKTNRNQQKVNGLRLRSSADYSASRLIWSSSIRISPEPFAFFCTLYVVCTEKIFKISRRRPTSQYLSWLQRRSCKLKFECPNLSGAFRFVFRSLYVGWTEKISKSANS